MKKSCSGNKSKLVRNDDSDIALNESKEITAGLVTDEQVGVDGTHVESGTNDERAGWLERKSINKSANGSPRASGKKKLQRTSLRLMKITSAKAAKWIENSFETKKGNEIVFQSGTSKNNSDFSKNQIEKETSEIASKDASQQFQVKTPESTKNKKEVLNSECTHLLKDNTETPKSIKAVQCMKFHTEDASNDDSSTYTSCNCKDQNNILGKKRASHPQKGIDSAKKIKMEGTNNSSSSNNNNNSNINNNNNKMNNGNNNIYNNSNNDCSSNNNDNGDKIALDSENVLKIELELEKKRKSATFKIRDIKTIVAESEFRNKKWKETFLKYKCPARWGIPIVKNCSEKWDGKEIPQKLLNRYQKYLSSKNLHHPVFLPADLENKSQESVSDNELTESPKETSTSDNGGRMTLRNRNQQKPVEIEDDFLKTFDDEEFLDDNSDDWMSKQKSGKRNRNNSRTKKNLTPNNQQLFTKSERHINNRKYGKTETKMNEDDIEGNTSLNSEEKNYKAECHEDTMVCPICSLRFSKQHIESHATECASKTFKD